MSQKSPFLFLLILLTVFLAPLISARESLAEGSAALQKPTPSSRRIWTIDLTGGFTLARGNTDGAQLSSTAKANRKTVRNETTFFMEGYYSNSRGVMDAQRTFGSGRYAYSFGSRRAWYHFSKVEVSHDKFAQIDLRLLPSTGLGYWWSDTLNFRLMGEVGVGFEQTKYYEGRSRTRQSVIVPRLFVERKIFDRAKFSEDLRFTFGSSQETGYRIDSQAHLINPLSTRLSIDIGLSNHYISKPPPTAKQNDLIVVTSLRYTY